MEASTRAMKNPRKFAKPCTMTALAVAMATPLSVIVHSSIANTIAACVGGKDAQSKVGHIYTSIYSHHFVHTCTHILCTCLYLSLSKLSAPISIGETFDGTVVKFDRKEFDDLLRSDQEWPRSRTTLRQRRKHQSRATVAPAPSSRGLLSEQEVDTETR